MQILFYDFIIYMIGVLKMTFEERIQKAISETKGECHYNPKAFIQMVDNYGALEAVKNFWLLNKIYRLGLKNFGNLED